MLGFVKTQRKGFFGIRMHYRTKERLNLIWQIPLFIIFYPLINEEAGKLLVGLFLTGLIILWGISFYCIIGSLNGSQFCYSFIELFT